MLIVKTDTQDWPAGCQTSAMVEKITMLFHQGHSFDRICEISRADIALVERVTNNLQTLNEISHH